MFKFALGLTSGLVLGGAGAMILTIIGIVALEDSPKVLETLRQNSITK